MANSTTMDETTSERNMLTALSSYKDWRMAKILLLGFISGFPWVLIASMMSLWLKSAGLSRTGIGLFGIVFTVYAFNMFWAPIVDSFKLGPLVKLGQRRSWIVLMQVCIGFLMLLLSISNPEESLVSISVICFLIALCSATQDVAVDAMRIELIDKEEADKVGAGSAMTTSGWWLGFGGMGAVGLFLAEFLEESAGLTNYWQISYLCLIAVIVISVFLLLFFVPEKKALVSDERKQDYDKFVKELSKTSRSVDSVIFAKNTIFAVLVAGILFSLFSFSYLADDMPTEIGLVQFLVLWLLWSLWIWAIVLIALSIGKISFSNSSAPLQQSITARIYSIWYLPVSSFVKNYGARIGLLIIALVFLFKVGEAFLGRMSIIFYNEVGFKKSDIALYSKGFGTMALIAFTIIGSLINARYGLFRGLLIGGIAMASTNLFFAVLAFYPEKWLFAVAVVTDQFTTAMSTVALVAFLSQLCDRAYTATQYAALASLGNFSRTTLAVASGAMVDGLGGNWSLFFVITTLMVLPSLALLIYIRKDIANVLEGQTTRIL